MIRAAFPSVSGNVTRTFQNGCSKIGVRSTPPPTAVSVRATLDVNSTDRPDRASITRSVAASLAGCENILPADPRRDCQATGSAAKNGTFKDFLVFPGQIAFQCGVPGLQDDFEPVPAGFAHFCSVNVLRETRP